MVLSKAQKGYLRLAGLALLLAATSAVAGSSTTLQWSWSNPNPSGDAFKAVAYGNGVYVAAGQDGVLYMSSDGTHWSPQSSAIGNGGNYLDAIYGGGNFLVAGVDAAGLSHLAVSSDGVHWTDAQIGLSVNGNIALAYGGGNYVAVGDHSAATSSDGVHWTVKTAPVYAQAFGSGIQYANSTFIIDNADVYFSTDGGATWTLSAGPSLATANSKIAGNGSTFFLFDTTDGVDYTSTDGDHWTQTTLHGMPPGFDANVLWDSTRFVTLSNIGQPSVLTYSVYTSPDGITWTKGASVSTPQDTGYSLAHLSPHAIAATGSGYIGAGPQAVNILQSADFATWTTGFAGTGPTTNFTDLIYAGGRYVAVGGTNGTSAGIMESADGVAWSSVYTGTGALGTVAYGNGIYVATGSSGPWLASTDGVTWNAVSNPPPPLVSSLDYGNGNFVGFTGDCTTSPCSGVASVTSQDGKSWVTHPLPAGFVNAFAYDDIGYTGMRFVALGAAQFDSSEHTKSTVPVFTSCDGVTWTNSSTFSVNVPSDSSAVRAPPDTDFYKLRRVGNGMAALGTQTISSTSDSSSPVVATSLDGSSWSATVIAQPGNISSEGAFSDIAFDGSTYYTAGSPYAAGGVTYGVQTSSDAAHWNILNGFPIAAEIAAFATNGNQLVGAGMNGAIVTTTLPTTVSTPPASSGTCQDLPAIQPPAQPAGSGKSGGGDFGLLPLAVLLGFAGSRQRRHGKPA